MRRSTKGSSPKLSADSQRLVMFAQAVVLAASRLEERAWERNLDALVQKLLKSGHQETIDAALDELFRIQSGAYDALMESLEAGSESCRIEHDGKLYDVLLIAMPILAWTRFSIASGPISPDTVAILSAHLCAHVLASDVRVAMAPMLFAIDQMPHSHVETLAVTQRLAQAALKSSTLKPVANAPETAPFLADTRYLLAAVAAPVGEPLFHWQAAMHLSERDTALHQWRNQAMPTIARLLPGCGIELLLPEAYYVACREADKQIRPASIRAATHYLTHTLGIEANELCASIGSFCEDTADERIDEYRIGFAQRHEPEVIYGVIWPLYGEEDDDSRIVAAAPSGRPTAAGEFAGNAGKTPLEQIVSLLQASGITRIKQHHERFSMEYCDDCGAPLYPDMEAELVHAEMPEDAPQGPGHLH
jgi:hypothetical protein